ncbi:hypothetical protein [Euzebya rosea]|uniref:hypothetical protein n=1 Tax=Euzebya rosea TaxID=2052804 RepID=UPI000D3E0D90|nr:hypothetical protein [Euzebya rosea]
MTTTAKTVSALAIAALLSLALFLSPVGISRAQEDDATEDTTDVPADDTTEDGSDRPDREPLTDEEREALRAEREAERQAFVDDVAAELGVTSDELTGAFRTVAIERVQEKVADGTITQERADEIIERIESSDGFGFGFGGRGHGRGHGHRGMGGHDAGVAESGSEI